MINVKFYWLLAAVGIWDSLAAEYLSVEKVYPAVVRQKRSADVSDHPRDLTVVVAQHRLNLEQNSDLISPFFVSHHEDQNGEDTYIKGHVNCFYHGSVEDHPDWHVAMSTCQGLRGIFGDPGHRDNYYYIEPMNEGTSMAQSHTLYRGYTDEGNSSCGVCSKHNHTSHKEPLLPPSSSRLVRRQGSMPRIVEWVLVNDYSQYQAYGENLTAVVLRDLEIANLVDSFYRPLDIRVVVVFTTTWTTGNKIQFPSDNNLDIILERFSLYEPTLTVEHDSTLLITAEDLPGNTLGYAYVGTMCRDELSVGLMEDGNKRLLDVIATIVAHELGHIFSMQHDNYTVCTCTDPSSRCIMAAITFTPPATTWSSCSVSYLNEGYRNNLDRCLFNTPQRTLEDPVCGNGIREGNETCDCGSVEECTDKCCDPLTCRLASGAQCNTGECCSESCQFHPLGTNCHNASNECDIMEYCSGDSPRCPRDLFKQDTTLCNDEQNYCYAGQCPMREDQCKLYYGSRNAPPSCYSVANVLGSRFGNCGSSSIRYLSCAPEHVDCGQLQCERGTFNNNLLRGLDYRPNYYILLSTVQCHSFTLLPGSDTISLGLVQEGTKCGNESMCLAQSCMAISSLTYVKPCPVGSNNLTCAGAGVCNNLNECSCELGLVGATCEGSSTTTAGEGSSSGKLSGGDIAGIFFGLLLGLLVAGGVAAVIVFVLYRQKNKKSSYKSRKQPWSSTHNSSKSVTTQKSTPSSKPPPKPTPSKPLPKPAPPRPVPSKLPPKPMSARPPPKPTPTKPPPKPIPSRPPPRATPSKPPTKVGPPAPTRPSQPDHSIRSPGKRPPPPRPPAPRC